MKAFGIQLQYTEDDGSTWLTVGKVREATPLASTKETIETTHHGTPGAVKTFCGGLVDPGEASVEIEYDPSDTDHAELKTRAQTALDEPEMYRFVLPDTSQEDFLAIITGFEPAAPIEDLLTATLTFKASGPITTTPAV